VKKITNRVFTNKVDILENG